MYPLLIRPLLFLLPPEAAHALGMTLLRLIAAIPFLRGLVARWLGSAAPGLSVSALGLRFPSPIGLAAGFDKDAVAMDGFAALGFGFVEVGTLTPLGQAPNPAPRLFRLHADRALINRMGFNNDGADAAARRLARRRGEALVGVNVGKNRTTPNAEAMGDYVRAATLLAPHADYMVVNVSSPNTPELRALQAPEHLGPLIRAVQAVCRDPALPRRVPLLLKISPDLEGTELDSIGRLARDLGIDGVIATNTTTARDGLRTPADRVEACGAGGLSGAPLAARSLHVLRRLRAAVGPDLTLISVGGIETATDVWERLEAGATLVQIYTALIYQGPGLVKRLNTQLAERLRTEGFEDLEALLRHVRARSDAPPPTPVELDGERPAPA
jgi:dihydroorotate dehydrogenase